MGLSGCLPIFFFICLVDSFPMKHEELVSATLCPVEYVYNNFTEKCYRVVTEPAELKFARELCSSDHASITEPVEEMERFMILAYAIEKLRPRSETFLWWGYEPRKCMALNDLGKVVSVDCHNKLPFICELQKGMYIKEQMRREPKFAVSSSNSAEVADPVHNSCDFGWREFSRTKSCYKTFYLEDPISWSDALRMCEKFAEAQLASISSIAENNIIVDLVRQTIPFKEMAFIGLRRERGAWRWSDKSPLRFQYFALLRRNNKKKGNCAAFLSVQSSTRKPLSKFYSKWFPVPCTESRIKAFVCEKKYDY